MSAQEWFYSKDGKNKLGPFSLAQLQALARSGHLSPTDMILKAGEKNRATADKIKRLFPPSAHSQTQPEKNTDIWAAGLSETQPGTLPVRCPQCGHVFALLRIPGIMANCPSCGKNLQFPESSPHEQFSQTAVRIQSFSGTRPRKRVLKILVWTLVLLIIPAALAAALWFFLWNKSPFEAYRNVIPDDATSVLYVDVAAVRARPEIAKEAKELDEASKAEIKDLRLEPKSARATSLLACFTKAGERLLVVTFDRPIQFADGPRGRYRMKMGVLEHRFPPKTCWTVDGQGRLIGGQLEVITDALDRDKTNRKAAGYDQLNKWVKNIPGDALAWGIVDFQGGTDDLGGGANPFSKVRINGLFFTIAYDANKSKDGPIFKGGIFFAAHSDAEDFKKALNEMPKALGKEYQEMLRNPELETKDTESTLQIAIHHRLLRLAFKFEIQEIEGERKRAWQEAERQFKAKIKEGEKEFDQAKKEQRRFLPAADGFRMAVAAFSEALELYSEDADAQERVQSAKKELEEEEKFLQTEKNASEAHVAARGAYQVAKTAYEKPAKTHFNKKALEELLRTAFDKLGEARALRPEDDRVKALQGKVIDLKDKQETLIEEKAFDDQKADADKALAPPPDLEKALACFGKALEFQKGVKVRPTEADEAKKIIGDLNQIRETKNKNLGPAQKAIKEKKFADAEGAADGLAPFLKGRLPLADKRLKPILNQMAKDTCDVYRGVMDHLRQGAKDLEQQGMKGLKNADFKTSKRNFSDGISKLDQSQKVCTKIKVLSTEDLGQIEKEIRDKRAELEDFIRKGDGLSLIKQAMDQGDGHMSKGITAVSCDRRSKSRATKLHEAEGAFAIATKDFDSAKTREVDQKLTDLRKELGWADPAEQSKIAQKQRQVAGLMICPFDLDVRKSKKFPSTWEPVKDWKVTGSGLQAKYQKGIQHLWPSMDEKHFPVDFDLEFEVGVVDRSGQLFKYNSAYHFWYKSWLKINLEGEAERKGDRFWIKLSQDPALRATRATLLETSQKDVEFKDITENPVKIHLRRVDKKAILSIEGRKKQLEFPLAQEFEGVSFSVRNENSPFPVIIRASLKIYEPEKQ
jgi:predicted  nucleic acid-binding Zn-ribbon protein